MTRKVGLTIEDRHQRFREDMHIQLSSVLRESLDQMIEDLGWEDE